jgi:hypothetical protein
MNAMTTILTAVSSSPVGISALSPLVSLSVVVILIVDCFVVVQKYVVFSRFNYSIWTIPKNLVLAF